MPLGALSLGYNVIACEEDESKFRDIISVLQTEASQCYERKVTPLTLTKSVLYTAKDGDDTIWMPGPQLFEKNAHKTPEYRQNSSIAMYKVNVDFCKILNVDANKYGPMFFANGLSNFKK